MNSKRLYNWFKGLFTKQTLASVIPFVKEPDRPNQGFELYYPKAIIDLHGKMQTRGTYKDNYPIGAVVHHTAGRYGTGAIRSGLENGYLYYTIDHDGKVYQNFPINKWGYHCGQSSWPSLGSGLSNKLVGIEVASAGKVTKVGSRYKAWFDMYLDDSQVRTITKESYKCNEGGSYHKFTQAQEDSLIELLLWLKNNNPKVFNLDYVLGHSEISPTRKNDPNGSLSMPMPELRKLLKEKYR